MKYTKQARDHAERGEGCGPCQACGRDVNYIDEADGGMGHCPLCHHSPCCPIEVASEEPEEDR